MLREGLCLLKRPFLLQPLMLRPTLDTLLGDGVGAPLDPPDIGAFAGRAPARRAGLTAPTAGAETHNRLGGCGSRERTVGSGCGLRHLDRMANGARHRQT